MTRLQDLLNNPTSTGIATGAALGAFAGGTYAIVAGKEDEIERFAARGSVAGGVLGVMVELSAHLGRLIAPMAGVPSRP